MATDNFPVDFRYISRRLTKDIVQQWVAGKDRVVVEPSALFGPIRLTMKVADIDYENPFLLAKLATAAVEDHTGRIDASDHRQRIPTGKYIRARMHLQFNELYVNGWRDGGNQRVAAFAGWETLPDFGPVFVGLVGSQSNVIGVQGEPTITRSGRTASDVRGLYDLIVATSEPGDASPSEYQLAKDATLDGPTKILCAAADSFRASDLLGPSEALEALFLVHEDLYSENVELGLQGPDGQPLPVFRVAVIGAPVWVATPQPRALEQISSLGHGKPAMSLGGSKKARKITVAEPPSESTVRALHSLGRDFPAKSDLRLVDLMDATGDLRNQWTTFDEWVRAYLQVWHRKVPEIQLAEWPPSDGSWNSFQSWAVEAAISTANLPWPFVRKVQVRTGLLRRKSDDWQDCGEAGWPTAPASDRASSRSRKSLNFMLLTSGEVIQSSAHGWESSTQDYRRSIAAEAILRTVARWRTPFGPWHWEDPSVSETGLISR